jgi:hypothetical protein
MISPMPGQLGNPGYRVYLMDVSYFSGKLEAYLRYKEIPFERVEVGWRQLGREVFPHTGIMKVPVVEMAGGDWLQDSTPIIGVWCRERLQEHFEAIPAHARPALEALLGQCGAWEPLWRDGKIASHLHDESEPPVCRPVRSGIRGAFVSQLRPWNPARGSG